MQDHPQPDQQMNFQKHSVVSFRKESKSDNSIGEKETKDLVFAKQTRRLGTCIV